jgi:5-formyltetrahydrofolate cyclo-ligase
MHPPISDTTILRNQIRLRRTELGAPEVKLASAKAASRLLDTAEYRQAARLAAYVASNNELNPHLVIKEAWNDGKSVYLPVIREDNRLSFAPYHIHSTLQKNRYRIPEPVCPAEELLSAADLDLILVPLVAFDADCQRIGMGAGYYDRTLAGLNSGRPVKAGMAYDFQRVERIQSQPWDIPMDMIVTEQRLYLKANMGNPA